MPLNLKQPEKSNYVSPFLEGEHLGPGPVVSMSFGCRISLQLHYGTVSTPLSHLFQTWPRECVRLSRFSGSDLGQLWFLLRWCPVPISIRRAVSAVLDVQRGRECLWANEFFLTILILDRVPQRHFDRALDAGIA